jgi:tetratricopeptide (TPR) repeat protein
MLGYAHAAQGHFALGLAEGERAVARARELNNPTRLVEVMATVAPIYFEGGDMPQFLAACQQTLEAAEKLGERVYTFFYVQRALAESRMENAETALARLTRDKASKLGRVRQTFWEDLLIAFEAEIRLNAGHPEQAISLAEQAVKISQREGSLYSGGVAERVWGQALTRLALPRYDDAETHFAASLQLFEEGSARLEAARTRVAWGTSLRSRGEMERAQEYFEKAAAQFEQSGLTRELNETRALLETQEAGA